jgi:hypothetical protein
MAIIIPPGYAEVTVKFRAGGSGRNGNSVFGVKTGDVPTQSAVDTLSTVLSGAYRALLKAPGIYIGIRVLIGQDGGPPAELNSTSGTGAGATNVEMVPPQVQVLIKKTTALSGRHNRGRTFFPDCPEANILSDGSLQAALVTSYQTVADNIKNAFNTAPTWAGMVLLHQTGSLTPTPVNSYLVQQKAATLRPRFVRA